MNGPASCAAGLNDGMCRRYRATLHEQGARRLRLIVPARQCLRAALHSNQRPALGWRPA